MSNVLNGLSDKYYPFDPDTDYKYCIWVFGPTKDYPQGKTINVTCFSKWSDVVLYSNSVKEELPNCSVRISELIYRTL